jgi:hypothetical protein
MRSLGAILGLAAVAACSTAALLAKAEAERSAEDRVPVAAKLELDGVVTQAVHGQVQYGDGRFWAALRPNMVLTNGVQIRPGADSSCDLFGGDGVSMRLVADHNQKITAFLVGRGRAWESAASVRSSGSHAIACAAAAIGAGGKVRINSGEMILTENGKTHLLRAGEQFDPYTGEVRGEIQSQPGPAPIPSWAAGQAEIVSAPRAVPFDGGLENARRGIRWLGE